MMKTRIVPILGVTTVVLAGVALWDLSPADVVLLFWIEGLVTTASVGVLLWLHRAATRKRGHFLIADTGLDEDGNSIRVEREGKNLPQYVGYSLFLHVVFSVFLWAGVVMLTRAELGDQPWGLANPAFVSSLGWIALISAGELLFDALRIGGRSMRWMIFRCVENYARLIVTALFVLFLFPVAMLVPWFPALLVLLICAKGLVDLLLQSLAHLRKGAEPPWPVRVLARRLPSWDDETRGFLRGLARQLAHDLERGEEVVPPDEYRRLMNA